MARSISGDAVSHSVERPVRAGTVCNTISPSELETTRHIPDETGTQPCEHDPHVERRATYPFGFAVFIITRYHLSSKKDHE